MLITKLEIEHAKGHVFVCDLEIEVHDYIDEPAKTNGDPLDCYEAEFYLDYEIVQITLSDRYRAKGQSLDQKRWVWCNHLKEHINKEKLDELVKKELDN